MKRRGQPRARRLQRVGRTRRLDRHRRLRRRARRPSHASGCATTSHGPIFDLGVSSDVAGRFGLPSRGGPCVTEPEDGALFPNNWLRPRVRVPGSTGALKITFHADKEANDLVAYTNGESWALPKDVWRKLAHHVVEQDITVTVQTPAGGATSVKFQVAPVGAGGSMVFWAANPAAAGKMGVESMSPARSSTIRC